MKMESRTVRSIKSGQTTSIIGLALCLRQTLSLLPPVLKGLSISLHTATETKKKTNTFINLLIVLTKHSLIHDKFTNITKLLSHLLLHFFIRTVNDQKKKKIGANTRLLFATLQLK